MADDTPSSVDQEITFHCDDLRGWIKGVEQLSVPKSAKAVSERFVRDCETLLKDYQEDKPLSTADMIDLADQRASLEIRYHNLLQEHQ